MANFDFITKSGAKLHISEAGFELQAELMETVKMLRRTMKLEGEEAMGELIATAQFREAMMKVGKHATYELEPVTIDLFKHPKFGLQAMGDYFEIGALLIEVNCRPFFLMTSLKSTDSKETPDYEHAVFELNKPETNR